MQIQNDAGTFHVDDLCGYVGGDRPEILREAFDLWGDELSEFKIVGDSGPLPDQVLLFNYTRKLLGKDTENYPQLIGDCLIAGTTILGETINPIEKVSVGDRVWTGRGRLARVISTQTLQTMKPMVKLYTKGSLPITCTADHLCLAYLVPMLGGKRVTKPRYERCLNGQGDSAGVVEAYEAISPEWIPAGELTEDHYLLSPVDYESVAPPEDKLIAKFWGTSAGRRMLGYFIGDGSANIGSVEFAVSVDSMSDELVSTLESFGYNPKVNSYYKKVEINSWRIRVHSRELVNCFRRHFYDENKTKVFPGWAIGNQDFLDGLCEADGCDLARSQSITSTSLSVVYGLMASLRSLGHNSSLGETVRSKGTYPNAKSLYKVEWVNDPQRYVNWRDDEFVCHRIVKTEFIEGPTTVYDIGVDDDHHSFVANGFVVHNCVSFGAKNAIEYVQALPILNGERQVFKKIFPPYLYGTGRVQVGGTRLGITDGSTGIWQATAVAKYGAIPSDMPSCPEYSGSVARQWGRGSGPPQQFLDEGSKHLIKSVAKATTLDDVRTGLANGYPTTVASNQGFQMTASSDGFHHQSGRWGHQMCVIAYGLATGGYPEFFGILNSWGDVHGAIKDFRDPSITWPVGMLRVTPQALLGMIQQDDSFIYSPYSGYPAQILPREDFDMWS